MIEANAQPTATCKTSQPRLSTQPTGHYMRRQCITHDRIQPVCTVSCRICFECFPTFAVELPLTVPECGSESAQQHTFHDAPTPFFFTRITLLHNFLRAAARDAAHRCRPPATAFSKPCCRPPDVASKPGYRISRFSKHKPSLKLNASLSLVPAFFSLVPALMPFSEGAQLARKCLTKSFDRR